MAHECPNCYYMCHCNGDIDDLLLNDEEDIVACTHCPDEPDDELEECARCLADVRDCVCSS